MSTLAADIRGPLEDVQPRQTTNDRLHVLFVDHHRALLKLAALLTGNHAAAEEIVQDAFAGIRPKLDRLTDGEAVPYLRTAVVNGARSRGRRLRVVARHRLERSRDVEAAETTALREAQRRLLSDAIGDLPQRQRECVVLRFYEGLSEAETASVLGISVNSVKTHVLRAKAQLAHILEAHR